MIQAKQLIVFGFGDYGEEIAKSLRPIYNDITIIDQYERHLTKAKEEGFAKTIKVNVHDDVSFSHLNIQDNAIVFCAFDDESFNTFLTLSLRAEFEVLNIIAIGQTKESMHKLKMAGASKVIIIEETGANITYNMLINPMVSSFLDQILSLNHDLNIAEIIIKEGSEIIGKKLRDLTQTSWEDIIILGMIDKEISNDFIFAHSGYNHKVDVGDALVVLGKNEAVSQLSHSLNQSN